MFLSRRESVLWLSGLMDGEGCLTLRRPKKHPNWETWAVAFRMTDKDSLERASRAINICIGVEKGILGPYNNSHKIGRHNEKGIYALDLQGADNIYALCCMMYPFLNLRRQEKIQEFITWYKGRK